MASPTTATAGGTGANTATWTETAQVNAEEVAATGRPMSGPGLAWLVFYVATLIEAAGLLVAFSGHHFGLGLLFFGAGLVLAAVWALAFLCTAVARQLHAATLRRWLGIPAIGILCFALGAADVPLRVRFELSRSELQRAANSVPAGGSHYPGGRQIGLFGIRYVHQLSYGVLFYMDSAGFFYTSCGLAYAANGRPQDRELTLETDLGGGWWYACEYFD
jgi:hypothetical protein